MLKPSQENWIWFLAHSLTICTSLVKYLTCSKSQIHNKLDSATPHPKKPWVQMTGAHFSLRKKQEFEDRLRSKCEHLGQLGSTMQSEFHLADDSGSTWSSYVRMDDKSWTISEAQAWGPWYHDFSSHKAHPYIFLYFLQVSFGFHMTFDLSILTRFVRNPISIQ